MRRVLLELLRCPACKSTMQLEAASDDGSEHVASGRLVCTGCASSAPVRERIPRLLELAAPGRAPVDDHTRRSFSLEWLLYRPEDGTWGMSLDERTKWYFLGGVGLDPDDVRGMRVLDAGCGNGSSTLGIARLGALCVGIDQSAGIEKAYDHFTDRDGKLDVCYVQGNLLDAPFAPESFDVVFSAGVLHHTPNTRQAFLALAPLVKPGGRFYVWLYRHEPVVTPAVNSIRVITTRLPPSAFLVAATALSPAFQILTRALNATGLRAYRPMSWRASALALMDIFGARYAHAHTYEEVAGWFEEAGFERPRLCGVERRGFAVCGAKRLGTTETTVACASQAST